jgi:hypothetical protein
MGPDLIHGAVKDSRHVECVLVDYLRSIRVAILDLAGEPHVHLVRYFEGEEATIAKLSIERLAEYLAREIML